MKAGPLSSIAAIGVLMFTAMPCQAAVFTVTNGNSQISVQANNATPGLTSWVVDGTQHAIQNARWYRVGSSGSEQTLDSIGFVSGSVTGNTATVNYLNAALSVQLKYVLTGGAAGSGSSLVQETIAVKNLGASQITFNIFDYADFDVNNTTLNTANAATGKNPPITGPTRTTGQFFMLEGSSTLISSDHNPATQNNSPLTYVGAAVGDPSLILSQLNDASTTDFPSLPSPDTVMNQNVAWVWQGRVTLNPNASFTLGITHSVTNGIISTTPEPASLAAWGGMGLFGLVMAARRRKQK
jgi:MYXO-CTERM domain-containing protein